MNSKATNTQKARDIDPAVLYQKVTQQIRSLAVVDKRADHRALVLADLQAGNPVVVRRGFTWEGETIPSGIEWHPGMEFLPRLATVLAAPGITLVTRDFYYAGKKKKELEAIAAKLTPLFGAVSKYQNQVEQERAAVRANKRAIEDATRAIEVHEREAEQAEQNLATASQAFKDFVAGLDFEI